MAIKDKVTGCFSRMEIETFNPPADSILICIRDPETFYPVVDRVEKGYRFIAHFDFWDTTPDKPDRARFPALSALMPWAKPEDIERIKSTIDSFYDYNIFASCEAGISRSAAVREYLFRRGWHPVSGAQERRMVHPNVYILAELEKLNRAATQSD